MPLRIDLTSDWTWERMEPFWPGVVGCLKKYADRYPDIVSLETLLTSAATGEKQLWIVHDEADPGVCVIAALTSIEKNLISGRVRMNFVDLGGSRAAEALPLISEMEKWGREKHGAEEFRFTGRPGWEPGLNRQNYRKRFIIYEKADV